MESRKRTRRTRRAVSLAGAAMLVAGMFAGMTASANADPASPGLNAPTVLRVANAQDIVYPEYPTDYVWWSLMDPHSKAKVLITSLPGGAPSGLLGINSTDPGGHYTNLLDLDAGPFTKTNMPSITSPKVDFRPNGPDSWRLRLESKGMVLDVTFDKARAGSAMQPVTWDVQPVFWASSVGTAEVNGTIKFPSGETVNARGWVGEEERMAGPFSLSPGHYGYEYAQSGNPDGSADQLFAFPNTDGGWRGHMAHTSADGVVTMCSEPTVRVSNWDKISVLNYPRTITAHCSTPNPLSRTWTVTDPHLLPLGLSEFGVNPLGLGDVVGIGNTTISDGRSDVPGSVATIQHLRDVGAYDPY